jgi:hypothetical protein
MADSMLVFYQRVLAQRRSLLPVLPHQMRWRSAPHGVLLFEHGRLTVAVNFLARPVDFKVRGRLLIGSKAQVRSRNGRLRLPPNSGAWLDNLAEL